MKGTIPILLPALTALVASIAVGLLGFWAGLSRPAANPGSLLSVFRYRLLPRLFTVVGSVFFLAAVTFLILLVPPLREEPLFFGLLYLLVILICTPLLWETAWFYVAIDDSGITYRSAWSGLHSFGWDEISELSYSNFNMWFVLRAENGTRIRVPILVANLKEFLHRVESHLPVDALRQARKGYEKVGRPFPPLLNDPVLEARPPR